MGRRYGYEGVREAEENSWTFFRCDVEIHTVLVGEHYCHDTVDMSGVRCASKIELNNPAHDSSRCHP